MTYKHFKIYCEIAISKSIIIRALKVSLIVGTTLNFINQGDALMALSFEHLSFTKLLLTYIVPYSVTTYTATAMKVEFQIGTKAVVDADLICKGCGAKIHVNEGQLVPECPSCGIYTKWKLN